MCNMQPPPCLEGLPNPLRPEDEDGIIWASAFHREDFDFAVIWFPPSEHEAIIASIASADREPTTTLGHIDRLPVELIHQMCLHLDILSLFRFRQTNTRARKLLETLREYRIVTTVALNALCALLRSRAAPWVTLGEFYDLLCTHNCSVCSQGYGNLVFLPTWIRCCSSCLRLHAPKLRVTTVVSARRDLDLSEESLAKIPILETIPGVYSPVLGDYGRFESGPSQDQVFQRRRVAFVSIQTALSHVPETPKRPVTPTTRLAFQACCALPSYDPRTSEVENGVSCAGCRLNKVYSRKGFIEHFASCRKARILWLNTNARASRVSSRV